MGIVFKIQDPYKWTLCPKQRALESRLGMKLSIVIGTYNQRDILKKALLSYDEQTCDPSGFEVVVVDSSSTDGSAQMAESLTPSYLLRYIVQQNKGKAQARNRGVEEATGNIILITDADMIADPGLVTAHIKAHDEIGRPTCFEGLAYNMATLNWPPDLEGLSPQVGHDYPNGKKLGWYYFLTGNISFPRRLFVEFRGFDTLFQGYGWEDLELGYRFYKSGVPLIYLKTAINYHYHVIGAADDIERNTDKGRSARLFMAKHPEVATFVGSHPLSKWAYRTFPRDGRLYRLMSQFCHQSTGVRQRLGVWFLKEHHYWEGLLADPSK